MNRTYPLLLTFILLLNSLWVLAQPDRRTAVKRLYIANDDHTDYMWTGNEAQYDSAFVHMLDYYMQQIDSTKSQPDDYQTRWNCDGSYWLRTYQKYRSPAQFDRLMGYVKSGHISSPLNSLVSVYGGQPTEAVLRGMFYAGRLERQYKIRFPLAVCMENQTLPLGLASLWAGAGAKYSWRGVCACATKIGERLRTRKHQLYRYMGVDNRGVLMKWYNIPGDNTGLGGYGETRQQHKATDAADSLIKTVGDLTALCDTISPQSTYPYNIAGAFGYGWDDLETYNAPIFSSAARQTTTPTRRVRVSNEEDFFRDVERTYPNLPAQSVSFGNEWDLYPASMNETTAQVRRATEKLRSAESLAALVSLKDSRFAHDLTPARHRAWDAFGLYWEHDWTADGPVTRQQRADWQIRQKDAIAAYVDTLHRRATIALGTLLKMGRQTRFYAFNSLSWTRSDIADFPFSGSSPVHVIDLSTNQEATSQLVQKNGQTYLRIWAANIPSVGYKVFDIRPGSLKRQPAPAKTNDRNRNGKPAEPEFIQNKYYRLRLRRSGVVSDLTDLRAGNRAVVKPTPAGGRLFNDLGATNPDAGNPVIVENRGPVSVTLRAVSTDPIAHTVRVTLFANSPRIEIENQIQANFGDVKTWAFSLNLSNPTTRHEELGAVLTAKKETRGGDYAAQNRTGGPARLDWLTFNHFADLSELNYGVTLSNQDCSFFRLGQSSPDSLWENSSQLNALAGGQVDGPKLGILNQNGASAFRYSFALTTHRGAFDAGAAMRFSLEHQNPLVTGAVTGSANMYPDKTYSLLTVSNPNWSIGSVLLWSLKPAEDGPQAGLITRFWNLTRSAVKPTIRLAQPIHQVWQTTHLETDERVLQTMRGSLNEPITSGQLATYRLLVGQR